MEKFIQALFNQTVLSKALLAYGIDKDDTKLLDGFENFIYEVSKDNKSFILRIGHDSRRNFNLVWGEAEFLNYLANGGLSVSRVCPSLSGQLIETVTASDGSKFVITLFEKAVGHPPNFKQASTDLFFNMGNYMGKLHALSKDFHPSQPQFTRLDITKDMATMTLTGNKYLPEGDEGILQAYKETTQSILQLPITVDSYGLCHIDFHGGNFFITESGKITLFDFDDCQYAWFIYDIAMALFYAISHNCTSPEKLSHARKFLSHFWLGYQENNCLDPIWLMEIPKFLKLREIDLYFAIHRSLDINNLDAWCASYMHQRRQKILDRVPFCDMDYVAFCQSI